MMQWCIRQHQTKIPMGRSDGFGNPNILALAQEDDRAPVGAQQPFLFVSEVTELVDRLQIRSHDGKRFVLAMFLRSQPPHSIMIECITSEVVSAESFHCQDNALLQ